MAADLRTNIVLEGTYDELKLMLMVVKEWGEKGRKVSIDDPLIKVENTREAITLNLCNMSDDDVEVFIKKCEDKIYIEARGPYGQYGDVSEAGLFEAIADAAPLAKFSATTAGFTTGEECSFSAELKKGKLYLSVVSYEDGIIGELYMDEVRKKLTAEKFCKMFKISKDAFDEDSYLEYLDENLDEGFLDFDYDTFMDYFGDADLDEDEFEEVADKVDNMLPDYDRFEAKYIKSIKKKMIYNPKAKQSSTEDNKLSGKTFVVTGKLHIFANRDEMKEKIESLGGNLSGSISSKTTALVTNTPDSGTSKNIKAQELGVEIITEQEFIDEYLN